MKYLLLLFMIIIFFPGCGDTGEISWDKPQQLYCEEDYDCGDGMSCVGTYCIHNNVDLSSMLQYTLEITPPDNFYQGREYLSGIQTLSQILQNRELNLPITQTVILKGEITSDQPGKITYNVVVTSPNDPEFQSIAKIIEKGDNHIAYEIELQEHLQHYQLTVIPNQIYPRRIIDIPEISKLRDNDNVNNESEITLDLIEFNELRFVETHTPYVLPLKIEGENSDISKIECYIFTVKNGVEEIVSNRLKNSDIIEEIQPINLKFLVKNEVENLSIKTIIERNHDQNQQDIYIQEFKREQHAQLLIPNPGVANWTTIYAQNLSSEVSYEDITVKIRGILNSGVITTYTKETRINVPLEIFLYPGSYSLQFIYSDYSDYASSQVQLIVKDKDISYNHHPLKKITHTGLLIGYDNNTISSGLLKFISTDPLFPVTQIVLTDYDGSFSTDLNPGTYRVEIDPRTNNYASWVYYNITIDESTNQDYNYTAPKGINALFEIYELGAKLYGSQISLSINNITDHCKGSQCPESDIIYRTVSDSDGYFLLTLPVIE